MASNMNTHTTEELLYGPNAPAFITLPQLARVLGITVRAAGAAAAHDRLWGLPILQPGGPNGIRRVPTAAVRELVEGWRREREPEEEVAR